MCQQQKPLQQRLFRPGVSLQTQTWTCLSIASRLYRNLRCEVIKCLGGKWMEQASLLEVEIVCASAIRGDQASQASQLEQDLACTENRQEHFRTLVDLLKLSKITTEGLRLVLLFALRYEQEYNSIAQLKEGLLGQRLHLLRYAGSQVRSSDLFQNKSFLQIAKSTFTNSFKGVENVYTQHKTHLSTVVESLMKGRLKETSYPYMQSKVSGTSAKDPPRRAIVFVVGGTTYEEAPEHLDVLRIEIKERRPDFCAKDAKKDKKKDQPVEQEIEVDENYVKVDLLVPLAPLIVQRCSGETGPSILQDILAQVPCPGLSELKVSVRCNGALLSPEIRQHLNPLLITLGGVHKLPKEQHLAQQEKVYAVLDAFGERQRTVPMAINAQQNVPFQAHLVYFLGTWPQHETREYLQLARLKVEAQNQRVKLVDFVRFDLLFRFTIVTRLLQLLQSLRRAVTTGGAPAKGAPPIVAAPPPVSPGWEAPEGKHLVKETLSSRIDGVQISLQARPRYLDGSWVRLSAALAEPMAELQAQEEETAGRSQEEASPEKAEDVPEVPPTVRYERLDTRTAEQLQKLRFDVEGILYRIEFVWFYSCITSAARTTVLKLLLQTVKQHNAEAMQLDLGQARAIATVKLDEEQKKLDTDIMTGFIVMDRRTRIIVVECLRDGQALSRLLEVLPEENTAKFKVLFNPELGFSKRLYVDFNLVLKQVKLRQSLDSLTQRPDLCLQSKCDPAVSRGLNQLMEMKRAERLSTRARIHVLKLMDSFPSAVCVEDIETQYGDFVAEKELHGGCLDDRDDNKSAHSRMTGRTGRSGRSGRSGGRSARSGSGQGSADQDGPQDIHEAEEAEHSDHDDAASVTEEVKVRNAKIFMKPKLESANPAYERHLRDREYQVLDAMSTNKLAVKELSRAMKEPNRGFVSPRPGTEVHIYSGQARNTAELQKKALREKMQDQGQLWTYSAERNSGCFPLLDKDVPLDRMLRQEVPQDSRELDNRKPFKYPSPREAADYRRMAKQVSDSRKAHLQTRWVENQLHPELQLKESQ
eukprot:g15270.t1